ncbi:hypothetical protein PybrP1_001677, partial [[Pythium] brassicae (nom. inval.)]
PRVIYLSEIIDYPSSEGKKTETICVRGGNNYDLAPNTPLEVRGNKSGAINGKGSVFREDNAIIQNVEISESNPHLDWDGDVLSLSGNIFYGKSVPLEKI